MTKEEWKKNDALLKVALKKMKIDFKRNTQTWEPIVFTGLLNTMEKDDYEIQCYDTDDNVILEGPNDPESLGEISYFYIVRRGIPDIVHNIFFGVKNDEELRIKLDLLV